MSKNASSQVLRKVLQRCARCKQSLEGHEYRLIATTILNPENRQRFRELLTAVEAHRWRTVLTFQEWIGNQDDAEVYAIRCPNGGLSVVLIDSPFELYDPHVMLRQESIESSEDASIFGDGLPDTDVWHTF
jgi:hypothetical protein